MQDEPRKSISDAGSSLPLIAVAAGTAATNESTGPAAAESAVEPVASPAWAKDLRALYNAVVEEALPDSFVALLAKLDTQD